MEIQIQHGLRQDSGERRCIDPCLNPDVRMVLSLISMLLLLLFLLSEDKDYKDIEE